MMNITRGKLIKYNHIWLIAFQKLTLYHKIQFLIQHKCMYILCALV